MGAGVSNYRLANAVSREGQLGVVSGTGLDGVLARRLQDGDKDGDIRHALEHFPFRNMANRILDRYFIPGGKNSHFQYKNVGLHNIQGNREPQEMCIASNFVEVFLAKEGHNNPVGINYLEKIQLPHIPSIYGAMLAGVDAIIMGAGIPLEIPNVIDSLLKNETASYPIWVVGNQPTDNYRTTFDPKQFQEDTNSKIKLSNPAFFPIIASATLATMLYKRTNGNISGFIIEGPLAGGHNAPPRGKLTLTEDGQPIYGPRDVVDLDEIKKLGLPFYLAGNYGSHDKYLEALSLGAAGIQVGTAFALCVESGIVPEVRRALVQKSLENKAKVFTDPVASPTGFPFKVAQLEGTLSEKSVYDARVRKCDLGFLREFYRKENGEVGYRCAAENIEAYISKGGKIENTFGRKCLCNALIANVGMPQKTSETDVEKCLITLGDDFAGIGKRFCKENNTEYTAKDVIKNILG